MQSSQIWSLCDVEGWKICFIEMIEEIHPYSDLLHKLTISHDSNIYEDDVSILNSIISDHKGLEFDFLELMACKFRGKYNYVRAFHASKPVDIKIVLRQGLSIFSVDDYFLMAQDIFINDNCPAITIEDVRSAVDRTESESVDRINKLYFFMTECYRKPPYDNYHKFGSEYMRAVAINLKVEDYFLKIQKGSRLYFHVMSLLKIFLINSFTVFCVLSFVTCLILRQKIQTG
jgi:hypothetical protein